MYGSPQQQQQRHRVVKATYSVTIRDKEWFNYIVLCMAGFLVTLVVGLYAWNYMPRAARRQSSVARDPAYRRHLYDRMANASRVGMDFRGLAVQQLWDQFTQQSFIGPDAQAADAQLYARAMVSQLEALLHPDVVGPLLLLGDVRNDPAFDEFERGVVHSVHAHVVNAIMMVRFGEEFGKLQAEGIAAIVEIQQKSDDARYADFVSRWLAFWKKVADAAGLANPYDACLSFYEFGLAWKKLKPIQDAKKQAIDNVIAGLRAAAAANGGAFPVLQMQPVHSDAAVGKKLSLADEVTPLYRKVLAQVAGWNASRGTLDVTNVWGDELIVRGPVDVRACVQTGSSVSSVLNRGLQEAFHEVGGHAVMYQNTDLRGLGLPTTDEYQFVVSEGNAQGMQAEILQSPAGYASVWPIIAQARPDLVRYNASQSMQAYLANSVVNGPYMLRYFGVNVPVTFNLFFGIVDACIVDAEASLFTDALAPGDFNARVAQCASGYFSRLAGAPVTLPPQMFYLVHETAGL